jgi:hypothetical protein
MSTDKLELYICTTCNQGFNAKLDAERCHKAIPVKVEGTLYTEFNTVQVEIVSDVKDYYYKNSHGNLRSVPPRAKIVAIWDAPVVDGETLMEVY